MWSAPRKDLRTAKHNGYIIAFVRDLTPTAEKTRINYSLIDIASTLEEAKAKRCVSGDLVFDAKTRKIVDDTAWFFDWELPLENHYAQRSIQKGYSLE